MIPGPRAICVFCGSSSGAKPIYAQTAAVLGRTLAERGQTLVYGGANVGLMGAVADAALAAGGLVHGVIPAALVDKEIAHRGLTDLDVVGSMHERKARMAELSDGFVALPGGAGTLEEIAEVWTWAQLGFHAKPVGFLNLAGYFDGLFAFIDHAVSQAFIKPVHAHMLIRDTDPVALLDAFAAYVPVSTPKWIGRDQS
ncbi:MAG TPA: TIGR00730 family Rossman fold protein [Caulobacteraceae bacterium]|jgi:hypothetical protein